MPAQLCRACGKRRVNITVVGTLDLCPKCVPVQLMRRQAFAALLERDGYTAEDYDDDPEVPENPRPYLNSEAPLGRYCCVTLNWSTSDGKHFYLPEFDDLLFATNRAEEYVEDDIFEELPVKIVDLDEGVEYHARAVYTWAEKPIPKEEA
jgi:hypothetical protein